MTPGLGRERDSLSRDELAELLPAPGVPGLRTDRRDVLEEFVMREIERSAENTERPEQPAVARPVAVRRPYVRGLLVGAAAAAVLAGAVLIASPFEDDTPAVPPQSSQGTLSVLQVLDRASAAAAGEEVPVPGPDQYVYVASQVRWSAEDDLESREIWMSPDGARIWLTQDSVTGPEGEEISDDGEPHAGLTSPTYDFLTGLSTDPETLLMHIYQEDLGEGGNPDERAFSVIGTLLREQLLPPGLAPALYQAAARIPGVEVVEEVTDAVGREGIAVARISEKYGKRTEWIFDLETYGYLGERVVAVADPDTVIGYTGVTERAVVDAMGERPGDQG